jgi:hypothetical protein
MNFLKPFAFELGDRWAVVDGEGEDGGRAEGLPVEAEALPPEVSGLKLELADREDVRPPATRVRPLLEKLLLRSYLRRWGGGISWTTSRV